MIQAVILACKDNRMKDFRKLDVYRATAHFPKEDLYGLTMQMRRSSASIPTNIAEGCGRDGDMELARFMHIASGSASELEYQCLLAYDLEFLDEATYHQLESQVTRVKRMLTGLAQKLKADRR